MLDSIVTSKTRVKLLMKFFLNPENRGYLRGLATEFGDSTNSVRIELNRLVNADLLSSKSSGRVIEYKANVKHSLFKEINSLVGKYIGVDKIIDKLVKKLGEVESAYLVGDYANGIDSGLIDIVLVGKININNLNDISIKQGKEINKKIRSLVLSAEEVKSLWNQLEMDKALLIWGNPISIS
tara:strand:- start:70 stop:615 length:546 start_codon:yes stop_codon:yes gene_type:complete